MKALETLTLGVHDGAIGEVPVWKTHKRATNWLAAIDVSPIAPGGFSREFARHSYSASTFYVVPDWLKAGVAVEFGTNYTSSGGSQTRDRWYGVVVSVTSKLLTLRRYATGEDAVAVFRRLRRLAQARAKRLGVPDAEYDPPAVEVARVRHDQGCQFCPDRPRSLIEARGTGLAGASTRSFRFCDACAAVLLKALPQALRK